MVQGFASRRPSGFDNRVTNIAIIGAGGHVGKPIADALIAQGEHRVTALTRTGSESQVPEGIHEIKRIDYDNHGSIVKALEGNEVLIITLSVMAPPESQDRLIDAAVEAGLKYIMLNEWGIDNDNESLAQESGGGVWGTPARRYVEKIGGGKTHWMALTSGCWYEHSLSLPLAYGFDFTSKTATFFDDGRTKTTTTTWKQSGIAVARLLALKVRPENSNDRGLTLSQFQDRPVFVSSFTISQRDIFESVLRVSGDKESDWTFVHEPSKERYDRGVEKFQAGEYVTGHVLRLYSRIFFPKGGGDFAYKTVNDGLGLPKEDLDEATKRALQQVQAGYKYGPGQH